MLINLSDVCGQVTETLPNGSPYIWAVHNSRHMLLVASVELTAANINKFSKMKFDNLAFRRKSVLDYKHYRRGGGKYWSYAPGLDFGYLIPTNKILLNTEHKGYSYVKVLIEDVEFTLNVSGGCGGDREGWTDYINPIVQLCGTRSLTKKHLNALSLVALSETSSLFEKRKPLKEDDLVMFNQLLISRLFSCNIQIGSKIVLGRGFSFEGQKVLDFSHKDKHSFICVSRSDFNVRVKSKQIDWVATAALNGWTIPVIEDVNSYNQEHVNV